MPETEEIENRILNSHNQIAPVAETIKNGGKLKARHIFLKEMSANQIINNPLQHKKEHH